MSSLATGSDCNSEHRVPMGGGTGLKRGGVNAPQEAAILGDCIYYLGKDRKIAKCSSALSLIVLGETQPMTFAHRGSRKRMEN